MRKLFLFIASSLLLTASAMAQTVQQSGTVTSGHVPWWVTSGVIGDGGSSADSPITSFGVTNNGGNGICVNSARSAAPGRNQLCFGASTSAPATISYQNYGNAAAGGINFVINGTTVAIPTGGGTFLFGSGTFTPGDVPCFLGSTGVLQDCGLALSNGTITVGNWQGTPIAIGFGGTGGMSAAAARTNLGLGSLALQNSTALSVTGVTLLTGVPNPVNPTDAVNLQTAQSLAAGLTILAPSGLATAAVLPNTPTYANGTAGVGATLTAGSNTTLTVDGTAAILNTVVLVKNQASAFQNGVYTVTTLGSGAAPWVLTRATYFDTPAQMVGGAYTFVTGGVTNINSGWALQTTVATVGTSSVSFVQFSSGASGTVTSAQISAGTGIVVTGTCTITSAGNCTVATSGAVEANTLRSVTSGPDTIATTDCGGTVQEGTGASGFWTVTLPAVAGFNAACQINVIDGDTVRGKGLSGFPTTMTSPNILWPGQIVQLKIVNGAWTASNPGRWKVPSAQTLHVDKTLGSNSNDCLAATTGACADAGQAWTNQQYLFDNSGSTPIIALACSETHAVALSMGGTPLGTNLVQLGPDGNCATSWTNTGPCISVADLAELNLDINASGSSGSISFSCNTSNTGSTGNILLHNSVVLDQEGVPIWTPGGGSDNYLFCDGPCEFTIANGVLQAGAGSGQYVIQMSEGGKGTQSGTINATASGGLTGGVYYLFGGAFLNIGTATGTGWSSIGTSKVYGHATVVTNGVIPDGGYSVGTSGVACTSLTSSC
jgi:hypothetical protein